jgi:class B basic helix-loop-helix protein 1/6/7
MPDRNVIPYAHSPSVRKLSKIATLLLAKNYILMQTNALEEMRKLVTYLSHSAGIPIPPCLPGGPPPPPLPPPPSPPFSLSSGSNGGAGGGDVTRLPSSLFPRLSMPPGLHFPVATSAAAAAAATSLLSSSPHHLSLGVMPHPHSLSDPPPPPVSHADSKRHSGSGHL